MSRQAGQRMLERRGVVIAKHGLEFGLVAVNQLSGEKNSLHCTMYICAQQT